MNLLSPEPGLIFWMLLSFGIVFIILGKYGFPVIVNMVEKRKAYIDESLESAKVTHAQLKEVKQESQRILNEVREEQIRILKEANEMGTKVINEAKTQATSEAMKIINDAKEAIRKEKENAMREVHNEIASLSIDIAEKVLRKNLEHNPSQQELIDRLIQEVQQN